MVRMVSIVLADDNLWYRVRIRTLLDTQHDMNVVAEAANGDDALRLVDELRPDILITDLEMPGKNGFELLYLVRTCSPETKSIILSAYGSKGYLKKAIHAGARGYLTKDPLWENLLPAVRTVLQEGVYFSPLLESRASEFLDNGD